MRAGCFRWTCRRFLRRGYTTQPLTRDPGKVPGFLRELTRGDLTERTSSNADAARNQLWPIALRSGERTALVRRIGGTAHAQSRGGAECTARACRRAGIERGTVRIGVAEHCGERRRSHVVYPGVATGACRRSQGAALYRDPSPARLSFHRGPLGH